MKEAEAWKAIATANILQARSKSGRRGTKSRTGCLLCKHRRVKCDEGRPRCQQCSTAGRKCEYAGSKSPPEPSRSSSPSEDSSVSTIERQLSPWALNPGDKRTFDYFLSWTAPRMGGSSMDKPFWCGPMLSLAQSEPVILDALLAISILYEHPQYMKTFLTNNEHYPTPRDHPAISPVSSIDNNYASALRYYNRSMKTLRKQVEANKASTLLALVSCMLFTCIEVIRDSVFSALALLTNGIKLLEQVSSCPLASDDALFKPTRQILIRMSLTAAAFGHWLPIDITPHPFIGGEDVVFHSLEDARDALFALNQDGHRFLQDAARLWKEFTEASDASHPDNQSNLDTSPFEHLSDPEEDQSQNQDDVLYTLRYGCSAEAAVTKHPGQEDIPFMLYEAAMYGDLSLLIPPVIQTAGDDLEHRIREWYHVFVRSGLARDHDDAACSLQMLYHVLLVSVAVRMAPMQTAFDDYTYHFREILRLAAAYNTKKSVERAVFTLEVGALAPLWFVILKCRIPSLRRQALSLLSTGVEKESVFGARSMGEIGVRIIAFEEQGLGLSLPSLGRTSPMQDIDDDRTPFEEQRIQNLEILVNRIVGRFEVRLTRYLRGAEGRLYKDVTDVPL
ncbi:uncharacterized protein RCC_06984 [Ramularia collo-cygni]|uniref:Zn(2)-C6 fungal-type domain-containing protein n=1 Tax=Ramularia collo-cygni TaxID=112498 RepID=A0A2D3VJK6_9PEZI|nr:uncharacterized protein RCC_06984 [Ramularia collo-cygni]CZT21123.1 uncharacterized protein RCC_06984 [Ramularia collo-cygni]